MPTSATGLLVRPDGPVAYEPAFEAMHELAARRLRGEIPDTLILLEHAPVFTAGRRSKPDHVRWDPEVMREAGAEFHEVDRGGSVTFHGPGQLVGYPIVDLGARPDVAGYVSRLEQTVIRAAADIGVRLDHPVGEQTGVWAGREKVCAIGVRVMRARVTLHGFALNCRTDLSWFEAIVPCGLHDRGVTSLSRVAGRDVTVEEMAPLIAGRFQDVFGVRLVDADESLTRPFARPAVVAG
jgi:lipoyl(octanoyl) transferase